MAQVMQCIQYNLNNGDNMTLFIALNRDNVVLEVFTNELECAKYCVKNKVQYIWKSINKGDIV